MSLRQLPLIELDWQPPAVPVIDAELLEAQLRRASAVRQAEREASVILKAAGRKAEQIVHQAYKTQRQVQVAAQEELARHQQEALLHSKARWLEDHVVSLREDDALERHIVRAVSDRIHDCIERVLTAWFYAQPLDNALCQRLTEQVVQMAEEGALQLHVHPEMAVLAQDKFGGQLTVNVNPSLARDEAVLSSSQLSISISPHRHFQQLLNWLRSSCDWAADMAGELRPVKGDIDSEE